MAHERACRLPNGENNTSRMPPPCLVFFVVCRNKSDAVAAQGEAPAMFQLLFAPYYVAPGYAAKRGWSPMNEGRGFFTQEELNKQSEGGDYARQHYSRHLDAVPGNK
jgi:hypothetical protein